MLLKKTILPFRKNIAFISALAIVLNLFVPSAFLVSKPLTHAENPGMCSAPVDVVLIMDRSGSMAYTSRCDWWQLVCKNKPSCSLGYEWVKNTDYNQTQAWCDARNQTAPHQSVYITLNKIAAAKSAVVGKTEPAQQGFLDLMKDNDQSALVSFATDATIDKQLNSDHKSTKNAVNNLVTTGATNIGDAINFGIQELNSTRANPQANHAMILLTDGMANKPAGPGYGEYAPDVAYALTKANAAAALGYKIFTIGLGTDGEINATMLQDIANSTGATYYHSPSETDLQTIYNSIAAQLCEEYGSIAGCVYNDQNNNGSIDLDEPTLSDWNITLTNGTINQTQTLSNGCYAFSGLPDSTYTITETVQTGWQQTYPTSGAHQVTISGHNDITAIDFANHYTEICTDTDNDGYSIEGGACGLIDCNDNNSAINPSVTEICDGVDNNCDAEVDEQFSDLGSTCSAGLGMCSNTGTKICSADGQSTICSASAGSPTTEICEGSLDENCDGTVDEGCNCTNGDTKTCNDALSGVGVCIQGTQACANGVWGACLGAVYPSTEICDGLDNNCDGQSDETFDNLNNSCSAGVGKCQASGAYMCSADLAGTICSATPGTPDESETCGNQIDDDCDGNVDENCTSGPICGNGILESGETCDDNNTTAGDGCSATCQTETPATCTSSISGKKYNGNQEDNIYLQNWEIKLYDQTETLKATSVTDANGRYVFENLCVGTYIIKEVQQTGWQQIFPVDENKKPIFYTDTITSENTNLTNRDFSNLQTSSITGFVYNDADGLITTTTDRSGLNNWIVNLFTGSATTTTATTSTDSTGHFEFNNLLPDNYNLTQILLTNWTQISTPATITLTANTTSANNNFINNYTGGSGGDDAICGNNVKESEEACDGTDGLTSGYHCTASCILEIDSPSTGSGSSSGGGSGGPTANVCNDGILNNQTEECDGIFGTPVGYTCTNTCKLQKNSPTTPTTDNTNNDQTADNTNLPTPETNNRPGEIGSGIAVIAPSVAGEYINEEPEKLPQVPTEMVFGAETTCPLCGWPNWIIIALLALVNCALYYYIYRQRLNSPGINNKKI